MTLTIDTRTPAEKVYNDLKTGAAWLKVQQITDNPSDMGAWVPSGAILTAEDAPEATDSFIAILEAMDGDE